MSVPGALHPWGSTDVVLFLQVPVLYLNLFEAWDLDLQRGVGPVGRATRQVHGIVPAAGDLCVQLGLQVGLQ